MKVTVKSISYGQVYPIIKKYGAPVDLHSGIISLKHSNARIQVGPLLRQDEWRVFDSSDVAVFDEKSIYKDILEYDGYGSVKGKVYLVLIDGSVTPSLIATYLQMEDPELPQREESKGIIDFYNKKVDYDALLSILDLGIDNISAQRENEALDRTIEEDKTLAEIIKSGSEEPFVTDGKGGYRLDGALDGTNLSLSVMKGGFAILGPVGSDFLNFNLDKGVLNDPFESSSGLTAFIGVGIALLLASRS